MKKLEYYLPNAANFQVTWINLENEQRLQKTSLVSHCENVWPKRNNVYPKRNTYNRKSTRSFKFFPFVSFSEVAEFKRRKSPQFTRSFKLLKYEHMLINKKTNETTFFQTCIVEFLKRIQI